VARSLGAMTTLTDETLDLSTAGGAPPVEVALTLTEPRARVRVKLPAGPARRAEAVVGTAGRSWAAKHYWTEDDGVVVYEFDEPLPAGEIILRFPR
jgi:hypothetical protein